MTILPGNPSNSCPVETALYILMPVGGKYRHFLTSKLYLMRLYFRLFRIVLSALCSRHDFPFNGDSMLHFTVMPWDCVLTLVGNDRYHSFMDLGRIDLMIRLGAWNALISERLQPFVQTAHIRYRYPLRIFQPFKLRTRLVYTDSRYFWMEHVFQSRNKVMATAISKNVLISHNKIMPTAHILGRIQAKIFFYPDTRIAVVNALESLLRSIQLLSFIML